MEKINTKIAGIFKYPAAKPLMKLMIDGDPYRFVREPENPYDKNAIALFINDIKVGYVPAKVAIILQNVEIHAIVKNPEWDGIEISYTTLQPNFNPENLP